MIVFNDGHAVYDMQKCTLICTLKCTLCSTVYKIVRFDHQWTNLAQKARGSLGLFVLLIFLALNKSVLSITHY